MGNVLVVPHTIGGILCTHLVWYPAPPVQGGKTPLWEACMNGSLKVTKLLLKAGADPNMGSEEVVSEQEPIAMFLYILVRNPYWCEHVTSQM
jgi:ankyrin repeat protein